VTKSHNPDVLRQDSLSIICSMKSSDISTNTMGSMGTLPLFLPFLDDSVVALVYCSTHSLLATSLTSGFSLSIPMLSDDSQFHSRTCLIASLPPSILSICQWFPRVCRHISCFHKFNSTMCLSLCSPPPYGVEEDEELVRVRNQFTTAITSNFYFR
jgi:hypothetical protein